MRLATVWLTVALLALTIGACDDTDNGSGADLPANNTPGPDPEADPNPDTPDPNPEGEPDPNPEAEPDPMPDCEEGERRCAGSTEVEVCEEGAFVVAETCQGGEVCAEGVCTIEQSCEPGQVQGCFDDTNLRVCNGAGNAFEREPCDEGLNCLDGACTDMICRPGSFTCIDRDFFMECDEAGQSFGEAEACPDGSVCADGACLSGCDLSQKFPSYIGCRYWSLDLDQYNDPFGDPSVVPHAVVLSNPGDREAIVTVTTQAQVVLEQPEVTVPPGGVEVITFPRLDVDGTSISNHSFYLESSWPVVAYQFNPLDNEGVASNDASLLLPVAALGREYIAMTWPTTPIPEQLGLPPQHGYVTIVATSPGRTEISFVPTANVNGGSNVPFMEMGSLQTFTLRQFQVLNIEADGSNLFSPSMDLTGTVIQADQPIAVFGGHEEAVVGEGCCAEHLEQQLLPVASWGSRYLAVQAESRGGSSDIWRVVAANDGTTIETVPPQPGAGSFTLNRGEWREIESDASFEIVASAPVQVGQYLKSQEDTVDVVGDPAFILAVPIDSFRDDYSVLTPADYNEDWLTVIRPSGVTVRLDGNAIADTSFRTFGSGDYEYAWVRVEDGQHTVESDEPFALTAYGYSGAVSYGYSGGLNLRVEDEEDEDNP